MIRSGRMDSKPGKGRRGGRETRWGATASVQAGRVDSQVRHQLWTGQQQALQATPAPATGLLGGRALPQAAGTAPGTSHSKAPPFHHDLSPSWAASELSVY